MIARLSPSPRTSGLADSSVGRAKCSLDHCRSTIASLKSYLKPAMINREVLVRLLAVVGCGFESDRQFRLALLFLISFLAGIDGSRHRTSLPGRGFTRGLGHFANLFGGLRVDLCCPLTSGFVVLTGSVA